jgi:UDP-N-acetylglucosamine acyltransferase
MTFIHPLALVDPTAKIADDVRVGPWARIGPQVELRAGVDIGDHVIVYGNTCIGENTRVYPFASVGCDPQDKKYAGEVTYLSIGKENVIREYVTISRGTGVFDPAAPVNLLSVPSEGIGITRIGDRNLLMAYVHIAHDCIVGNDNIFSNAATLAGHVIVEHCTILSGFSGLHQFCRMGSFSFLGMRAGVSQDVAPYTLVAGADPGTRGVNVVGLKRHGFSEELIQILRKAYKIVFREGMTVKRAIEALAEYQHVAEIQYLIGFIQNSERGIVR